MKEKYVVLTPFFPSEKDFSGVYIYDQVKAIECASNYDVIVIKLITSGIEDAYNYQGVSVHEVKLIDLPSFILPGLFNRLNYKRILDKLLMLLKDGLDHVRFIHGHVSYPCGVLTSLLAKKINAVSIIQHHGFDVMGYTNGRLQPYWFRQLNKKWIDKYHVPYLNQVDWNIGVSKKTLKVLHDINGYQPAKESVLYNGVDLNKFHPVLGLRNNDIFTIGCVGNFWVIKDQLTLIKAVQNLIVDNLFDNIRLKFIGDGETLLFCKAYVIEHNLSRNVVFLDTQDHTQLNIFYNTLNLFVLPSYYEAFGCVYTEAHACGVPFIGVEGQGIEELVLPENKQYQLVKPKQVDELSEKIKYFYQNRDFNPNLNQSIALTDLVKGFLEMLNKNEVHSKI
jgi:glycosyltransferase involved in cell wall biosynthesis